jgi:hypothetical protein
MSLVNAATSRKLPAEPCARSAPELDRLPDGTRDVVQDVHGGDDFGAVVIMGGDTARHRQWGARSSELARQALDHARFDSHYLGYHGRGWQGQAQGVGRHRGQSLAHDHLRHRQREQPFGFRLDCQPLIGHETGLRHARRHVYELRHPRVASGLEAVRLSEPVLETDRRKPRFHEIGAERQDIPGAAKSYHGRLVAKGEAVPSRNASNANGS